MASNDSILHFYEKFSQYPRSYNAVYQNELAIDALEQQLDYRSEKVFEDDESKSYVDFLETHGDDHTKFIVKGIEGSGNLKAHLTKPIGDHHKDPRCRFVFIHSPHSRQRLRISLPMMKQILHYHQVMPSFLEHVFPFRSQHRREDFHVAGFRTQPCIEQPNVAAQILNTKRSGRHLEFCYNLKFVESTGEPSNAWSIRQCSIHHQFDLESQRATWIVLKGNQDTRDLLQARLNGLNSHRLGLSVSSALKFSLKIHLEFCRCAVENWHSYINKLESNLQEKTLRALSTRVDNLPSQTKLQNGLSVTTVSTETEKSLVDPTGTIVPNAVLTNSPTMISASSRVNTLQTVQQPQNSGTKFPTLVVRQQPFSFKDVQQAHTWEEKANDALLILQSNCQVICQLKREYENLLDSDDCPKCIIDDCKSAIKQFGRTIDGIDSELRTIQCRVQALLQLIQERKTLLYGILEYQNMEANRDLAEKSHFLAEKSHESNKEMERMTHEMHTIAEKTRVDTASMKTITTVTLFFLPGTFISTIMSTPIIRFESGQNNIGDQEIGYGALKLFALVSAPLMVLTFVAWGLVNWLEKRKVKKKGLSTTLPLHHSSNGKP